MPDLTEIREPNFTLDLPGEWEQGPSDADETLVFRELNGFGSVSVTLLAVRPMFEIADMLRLLEDYMAHRQTFESGPASALKNSQPVARQVDEGFEGEWSAENPYERRYVKHRVLLVGGSLLADFAFETTGLEEAEFAERAATVLGTATATA